MKGNQRILAVSSGELVAVKAQYHCTCYRDYTIHVNNDETAKTSLSMLTEDNETESSPEAKYSDYWQKSHRSRE